ncbi:UPF0489 family protein [Chryseobacterium gleum]|uniref:UPF0489 family protein n=1 Tax=Chryseobacterium gleum TaxID=250 RepID=UPI0028AC1282|nr:UPF0489 family protein [Chryseobacterium gleum]
MYIPAFIIEEHHEAFLVWNYAYKKQIIGLNNDLLHFDDHSDMSPPKLNIALTFDNLETIEKVKEFTYSELGIASFMLPAVYLNIVNNIFWFKIDRKPKESFAMFLKSYHDDDRFLITGKKEALLPGQISKSTQFYEYHKLSLLATGENFRSNKILLDIDLDFFSCIDNPYHEKEVIIEITEEEYNGFITNKYHYLRFITNNIEAVHNNGSYFYIINNHKFIYSSPREVSREEILNRIDDFKNYLITENITPDLITICRSRFSGFTPENQWQFIENSLLKVLSDVYKIEIIHIDEI